MKLPNLQFTVKDLKLRTAILFVFSLYILTFVVAPSAWAQEMQRSFTLSYPTLMHKLNPGQTAQGITKITNNSAATLTFKLAVRDYVVLDNNGTPTILPPNTLSNKYSASAWIAIYPQTFTLQPGQKQTIDYYLQVPADARPGGHYAAIVYTPIVTTPLGEGSGSTINSQLGSLFYITVNGPIKEQAVVSRFLVNPFQEYGPVNVFTELKNLGDLHITPQGTITVSGALFNQTQKLATYNIFPGGVARDYQNTFGKTLMIGPYKAVLMASYGVNNNLPLTATVYFWVFPWRIALVITLAIIAIILGFLYFRNRKKTAQKQPEEPTTEAKTPPAEKKE
jgi:hypothetical protein